MENSSTLGLLEIIRESLKIPLKNPHFIFLTLLTSFPLFCFLVFYEIILQQILIESAGILHKTSEPLAELFGNGYERLHEMGNLLGKVSPMVLLLGFLFTVTLHFLDLFNTTATVDIASKIHAGEIPFSLKHMICRSLNETRFKAPLITSLCSLSLASLIHLGLLSFATYIYMTAAAAGIFFVSIFVVLFLALLAKYVEWSGIWNVGIVISILEDNRQGDVALLVSSYLTRCNRRGGFMLMLGFLAWRFGLRFAFLYHRWNYGNSSIVGITAVHIGLVCLGNLLKWVALMLYFYDCRKQSSYQITDVEEAKIQE
ncbi:hypothetical protein GQ457_02G020150 [Hibiscus cannabinus]